MAVARAVRAALVLVAALAAVPAAAQVSARPVAIYPFARGEGAAAEDAQALLESALQRAANRSEDIVLSEPIVVRGSCGPAQSAPVECLARLAGNGLLLRAVLHRSERSAALAVEAVDGVTGRAIGPVTVGIDTFIQNAEPLARALLMLFEDVRGAARRQAGSAPRAPPLPPPPVRAEPPAKVAAVTPAAPKADLRAEGSAAAPKALAAGHPADVSVARSAPRRSWLRGLAPWCAGTGLALLAGAATVSILNEQTSDELDRRYHAGELTPADAAKYRQVEQYNKLTIALAGAGGAITLTSAVLFTVVPSHGGASVAVAARF